MHFLTGAGLKPKTRRRLGFALYVAAGLLLGLVVSTNVSHMPPAPAEFEDYVLFPLDILVHMLYRLLGPLLFLLPVLSGFVGFQLRQRSTARVRRRILAALVLYLDSVLVFGVLGRLFPVDAAGMPGRVMYAAFTPVVATLILLVAVLVCSLAFYSLASGQGLRVIGVQIARLVFGSPSPTGGARKPADQAGSNRSGGSAQSRLSVSVLRADRRLVIEPVESGDASVDEPAARRVATVRRVETVLREYTLPLQLRSFHGGYGTLVMRYDLLPGASLSDIARKQPDVLFRLADLFPIVSAPIAGESCIGFYLSLPEAEPLDFRHGITKASFNQMQLPVYVGYAADGEHAVFDLAQQPHLLVAGASGSGKSCFIRTLVLSLLASPQAPRTRFVLIDPKRVELAAFSAIPHLARPPVTGTEDAAEVLETVALEMERRYELLQHSRARSIAEYNGRARNAMSYVVVIIDEAADLLLSGRKAVLDPLVRLSQKARAVGIHLVLGTQRPSADVVTGLLKANIPARVAFKTAGKTDSRIVLESDGAEALRGSGDGLLKTVDRLVPLRFQAPWIAANHVERVLETL